MHSLGAETTNDRSWLRFAWLYLLAASAAAAEKLFKLHGVRWIVLNFLAGWFPRFKQSLDFMHCVFLGLSSRLVAAR